MNLQRSTSLFLLVFMGLFGVLETTVSALAPVLGVDLAVTACPPEMTMCPMHAGEPCCCGMAGEEDATPMARFGEGCLDAPQAPPVTFPVSPFFRYLLPESAGLDRPREILPADLSTETHALPAFYEPLTPPPQSL